VARQVAFTCEATDDQAPVIGSPVSLDTIYYQILSRDRRWSKCHFRMDDNYELRVIEPGQREPMCKSNIGCCDTYAHCMYYTVYRDSLRSSIRELLWTIQCIAKILEDPHSSRKIHTRSYSLQIITVEIIRWFFLVIVI